MTLALDAYRRSLARHVNTCCGVTHTGVASNLGNNRTRSKRLFDYHALKSSLS
jgi:hypothetical protein